MSTLPSPAAQAFGEATAEDQHLTAEEAQALLQACYTQYSLKLHDIVKGVARDVG